VTAGAIVVLLLAAAVVAFVVAPLLRPGAAEATRRNAALDEERELESRNQMVLSGLRDLEDDRATAKIGDEDYARIKARLSGQAVEIMRRLDQLGAEREAAQASAREAARPLRYPGPSRSGPSR
jgi:hypothetical protein